MSLKLLSEYNDISTINDFSVLTEAYDGSDNKRTKIRGPFIMCEQKNRNGRIYRTSTMRRALEKYKTDFIDRNRSIGELNHPSDPKKIGEVDMERGCILVEGYEWDGDNVIGTARVLENLPMGRILKSYLDEGIQCGVSSRAFGTVGKDGYVNEDLRLITLGDCVWDASAHIAYVEAITENYEFIIDGDVIVEKAINDLKNDLSKRGDSEGQKMALTAFINKIRSSK